MIFVLLISVTSVALLITMADEEFFDVLTKDGNKTGEIRTRKDCHKEGLYHRAVHVWIFDKATQQFLIQKRTTTKDSFPGLWDVSSAGHISAGQSSKEAAIREIEEELGLKFEEKQLEFLFTLANNFVLNEGKFIDNEFVDVFLIMPDHQIALSDIVLQVEEVDEVKWIDAKDLQFKLTNKASDCVPCDVSRYPLFEKLVEFGLLHS